ncbi:MAG: STAS domain-containing protein, partial [Nannocystaceae bacterium]
RVERRLLRAIMDSLDLVLWAIDRDGVFVYHDGKGLIGAGLKPGEHLGKNIFDLYPPESNNLVKNALAGTPAHSQSAAHGVEWESWTVPVRGEQDVDLVVGITLNITEAAQREQRLKEQIETIQTQQQAIHELSAPLIEVWDRVVTVPLIGVLDSSRARDLMERLLTEVTRIGARHAILDLTGVEAVDTVTASYIMRMLAALRLLGAEGLISGINPFVAQTMVGIGVDMSMVKTYANLRESLRYCMSQQ